MTSFALLLGTGFTAKFFPIIKVADATRNPPIAITIIATSFEKVMSWKNLSSVRDPSKIGAIATNVVPMNWNRSISLMLACFMFCFLCVDIPVEKVSKISNHLKLS